MNKLWQKTDISNQKIEAFTIGDDLIFDEQLAYWDVEGSKAHIKMLQSIGLLHTDELATLLQELEVIQASIVAGDFKIEQGVEDVHSQIEFLLTERLGDLGKKIHAGRSRNDQVLVDLRLFYRHELQQIAALVSTLFTTLQAQSEQYKDVLLPGYTHLQVAMPSSFGLWFGAFAENLCDDIKQLATTYEIINQNPLGSAAGYGSSFPLNRKMTTELLGFEDLCYNVIHAQMGRGRSEMQVAFSFASIAQTLNKLASDSCLFMSQNFGFIQLPDELTTGSSIMPHKKNPDVFELLRGKSNQLMQLPAQVIALQNNLPTGYFRDYQLLKEPIFPAIQLLKSSLEMAIYMVENIQVKTDVLNDDKYKYLFTVEKVNQLVLDGLSFRDAYLKIGKEVEAGTFEYQPKIAHTHEGSIGNLCTADIRNKFEKNAKVFE